jgi:hypothetical protein
MDVVLAHPKGFELEDVVLDAANANVDRYGGNFSVINDMKSAFEELSRASHKLAEVMYAKASKQASGGGAPHGEPGASTGGGTGKDEAVDADFEEVKE